MAEKTRIGGAGELFIGEDKDVRLEVLTRAGIPVDVTGWAVRFVVKVDERAADEDALIDVTGVIEGVYSAVRSTNTQRVVFTLTDEDTDPLEARTYKYAARRTDNDSNTVLAWGTFTPQLAVITE